jgi:hypothetical protein
MEHNKGCKHASLLWKAGGLSTRGLFCTRDTISHLKRAVRKTQILSRKKKLKKKSAKIYINKKLFKSINNSAPEC